MRIARYLALAGLASRRRAEQLVRAGKVRVNGVRLESPASNVGPDDAVLVDGRPVQLADRVRLWRFHKPKGMLTTHRDPQGRPCLFDHLPDGMGRVISVGRLDMNSEGLILLTNDGGIARVLTLPATGWVRRYRVRLRGPLDARRLEGLASGLTVDGVRYGPILARLESPGAQTDRSASQTSWVQVSLREGRNREIRRVMQALGCQVARLIRISYGPFQLGGLAAGRIAEVQGPVLRAQLGGLLRQGGLESGGLESGGLGSGGPGSGRPGSEPPHRARDEG